MLAIFSFELQTSIYKHLLDIATVLSHSFIMLSMSELLHFSTSLDLRKWHHLLSYCLNFGVRVDSLSPFFPTYK